jgi:hypothetical protein
MAKKKVEMQNLQDSAARQKTVLQDHTVLGKPICVAITTPGAATWHCVLCA